MKRVVFALEDELEIEKLYDAEVLADKNSEVDNLYQTTKANIENQRRAEEEEPEEDTPPSNAADGSDDEPKEDEDSGEEEKAPEEPDAEEKIANEAMQLYAYNCVANEDIYETGKSVGNAVYQTGAAVVDAAASLVAWAAPKLKYLGVTYGPPIARGFYKGALAVFCGISGLLYASTVAVTKYLDRRVNSFDSLKKDIDRLKRTVELIKENDSESGIEPRDLTGLKFDREKVINTLKIGDSIKFADNLKVLSDFTGIYIAALDKAIKNDSRNVMHIIAYSETGVIKPPISLLSVDAATMLPGASKGSIEGYEPSSELVSSYHYSKQLPGDVSFIAYLPIKDINNVEDASKAYNASSMFLGFNTKTFKARDSVDYMTLDGLSTFLDVMSGLCETCIAHQHFYEEIKKGKVGMRFTIKNYFLKMAASKEKVSLRNSLVEYVYLKNLLIDKVYLVAAMAIHDYVAKVLVSATSFAKENVRKLN